MIKRPERRLQRIHVKSIWIRQSRSLSTLTKSFMGTCSDFMSNIEKGNLAQSRFFCFFRKSVALQFMKHMRLPEHLSVFRFIKIKQ